ncbi:right-handed parallel beta-helix repeat-containing protein [Bradyrhizobium lablabi]|uniref:right-handed parallel beta-helix repeat-containing protein n=1 Tax=Bradyrhizobium lablabi TaxID=722472 RepID=UPI001BA7B72E|nr:right-handed parallel beta-helix repeat-containing protein [Bradyrhizobium lablabi]MBR0693672.1 hypothetical protein [Bradyrhizobium lablabi]
MIGARRALLGRSGGSAGRQPTYFFSAAGSDANDGRSISSPKQTLAAFNALSLTPTDYVAFRGGDTFSGTMTIPNGGSALSRVIIGSYGVGKPTISAPANSNAVVANNLSYLTIKNISVTGSGTTNGDGITINNTAGAATDVTIDSCTATGFAHDGIWANVTGGSITNIAITNCTTNGNSTGAINNGCGIQLRGVYGAQISGAYSFINPLIFNCVANNNTGANGTTNWCGSGIHTAQCSGGGIFASSADNNGAGCNAGSGPSGIWISDCSAHVIQSCESSNNKTALNDGVGFDMDGGCVNCILQYSYSHGNMGAGLMCFAYSDPSFINGNLNNIIRFNVSANDANGASTIEGGVFIVSANGTPNTGFQVYGNTVFTAGSSATSACVVLGQNTGALSGTIANNIFMSRANSKLTITNGTMSGVAVTGNCWFPVANQSFSLNWAGTTYSSYSAWQTATGLEKIAGVNVGLNTDPLLCNIGYSASLASSSASQKNSFKLQPTSPCLGTGVNLLTQYSINVGGRDYFNNVAPRAVGVYDMGCAQGAAVLGPQVTATLTDNAADTTSGTTFAFGSRSWSIGTADASRIVVADVVARIAASTTVTATSLTIGGITFTLIPGSDGRQTNGGNLTTHSKWMALIPTGTTLGAASLVMSGSTVRVAMTLHSVVNADQVFPQNCNVANFTDATTGVTATGLLTCPGNGVALIGASLASVASGTPTCTPTNYTNDLAGTAFGISAYSTGTSSASGQKVYSSVWSGNTPQSASGSYAAWGPIIQ